MSMPGNSDRESLESVMGIAQAAMAGMMVHMRPVLEAKIRAVLERNATIVDCRPEALAHLIGELADELFQLPEAPV